MAGRKYTPAPPTSSATAGRQEVTGQPMNLLYVLVPLVPAAFALGWWASRQVGARRSGAEVSELSSDYFRGLNYLLNEEQDKAIEVFLKLAEYNRSEEHTSALQALMRNSYAVFCVKKKKNTKQ